MENNNSIGRRLRVARKNKKMSQDEFAKKLQVSKQAISNWETGTNYPQGDKLVTMGNILGVSVNWILTGNESRQVDIKGVNDYGVKGVPIFTFEEILDLDKYRDASEDREYFPNYYNAGPNSFAFTINDTSMSPEFTEGDLVIIDPSIKPLPGDYVCAKVQSLNKAIFRVYKSSGVLSNQYENFILNAINPNWDNVTINGNGQIIGVMVQHSRPRRTK